MKISKLIAGVILTSALSVSAGHAADFQPAPLSEPRTDGIDANPIKRFPPEYPADAARKSQTGWVLMEFNLNPDGSTTNVHVADSEPPGVFDRASIRAVKKWKYTPHNKNEIRGPIQTVLTFELEGLIEESQEFKKSRRKISDAIKSSDLQTAKAELKLLRNYEADTFVKIFYQSLFEYAIALAEEDYLTAHSSLSRALTAADSRLTKEARKTHLRQIFLLEIEISLFSNAIYHFEELEKISSKEEIRELRPYYDKVLALLQGPRPILYKAQTETNCVYCTKTNSTTTIHPFRSDFQIQNIDGKVEDIRIRCHTNDKIRSNRSSESIRTESFNVSDPIHFRVDPRPNENCSIIVLGQPGTAFNIIEFWANPANHTDYQRKALQE